METLADEAGAPTVSGRRRPGTIRLASVALATVIAAYLTLSWFAPHTVPRFSFLPKPPAGERSRGECGNWQYPDWADQDGFWRPVTWSTLVGCI